VDWIHLDHNGFIVVYFMMLSVTQVVLLRMAIPLMTNKLERKWYSPGIWLGAETEDRDNSEIL
jgi:hypothetical protein